jgi:5'-nucleotidase
MHPFFRLFRLGLGFLLGASLGAAPVEVTILQINDVYEIAAVAGGSEGGLARLATIREELAAENPHVLTVIAGDFFSPSALSTARFEGSRLDGRQMVACLNALPLDLATFGNHEFDLDAGAFAARLAEAEFKWVATNVTGPDGAPLPGSAPIQRFTFANADGESATLAFFGVTLPDYQKPYAVVGDPWAAAQAAVAELRADDGVDAIIGLTHQSIEADLALATGLPGISLIMGGHEHENMYFQRGKTPTVVAKADANARTVWVHRLSIDPAADTTEVRSELLHLDESVARDPRMADIVETWNERAFAGFRAEGFEPRSVVALPTVPLDGREVEVRNGVTNLSGLIADAYLAAVPGAELAFYNSGSIRIDDVLPVGPMTQYDVIRVHPFGGRVAEVRIAGNILARVLDTGIANRGSGGFLQTSKVAPDPAQEGEWLIDGEPLDPYRIYRVALNDFLLTGKEAGLDFLHPDVGKIRLEGKHADVRAAVIEELQRRFPVPEK